jgi:hypothetical protein
MDPTSDLILIRNIRSGVDVDACLKEIIRRHSGIFISIINNICPKKECIEIKDLVQEKDFYIYRTVLKFKEEKNVKFCTYLGNEARWLALDVLSANKKFKKEPLLLTLPLSCPPGETRKEAAESTLTKVWDLARGHKDKRVQRIFELRYIDGNKNKVMPWKRIAKKLDLSIQGCINIHNNFIEKIKKELIT